MLKNSTLSYILVHAAVAEHSQSAKVYFTRLSAHAWIRQHSAMIAGSTGVGRRRWIRTLIKTNAI